MDFFWSVFSRIRTEYGEVLRISPYSVRMRENANHTRKYQNTDTFYAVISINRAGLDKLENKIGFTVDTHEDENINMKPTVMKFCTNTRFDRAHLKIRTELQKTQFQFLSKFDQCLLSHV